MTPKVSVITAVFDLVKSGRTASFAQCVNSVRSQTYGNIEHLVIDGGSRDGTVELLKEYAARGWIRFLSEPDRGVYEAMNKGARMATGEYLAFLNSDDWWHDPRGVDASVAALESSGADFSAAPSWHYSPDGKILARFMPSHLGRFFLLMPFCHQTMFTRKRAFDAIGGFRDRTFRSAADFDFVLRLCLSGAHPVAVALNFTSYRLGGMSDTGQQLSRDECIASMQEAFVRFDPAFSRHDGAAALLEHRISNRVFDGVANSVAPELRRLIEELPRYPCSETEALVDCGLYSYPVEWSRRSYFFLGVPVLRLWSNPLVRVIQIFEREVSRRPIALNPSVTVVTVVRNAVEIGRREALLRCLRSVQAQVAVDVEQVVIDGASTDGTLELLRGFAPGRHPVRIFSGRDGGIYEAMNKGIKAARGKFIAFLNSDDYYHDPLGLAESVSRLEATNADFSYGPVRFADADGKTIDHCHSCPDVSLFIVRMVFSHQSVVMRKRMLHQLNGFDVSYRSAADYDLLLRAVLAHARAVPVHRPFVTFSDGGFSKENEDLGQREVGRIFSRLYGPLDAVRHEEEFWLRAYLDRCLPSKVKKALYGCLRQTFLLPELKPLDRITPSDFWYLENTYDVEPWGSWCGDSFAVTTPLREAWRGRELKARLRVGVYLAPARPRQEITVLIGGRKMAVLPLAEDVSELETRVGPPVLHEVSMVLSPRQTRGGSIRIEVRSKQKAARMCDISGGSDRRCVSLAFGGMDLEVT